MSPAVYVVDDDPEMRGLLEVFLKALNLDSKCFPSIQALVRALRMNAERPKVIISDWCVGATEGGELLQTARRDYPEIPVLIVTAHQPSEIRGKGMDGTPCLTKPFTVQALESALKCLIGWK